MEVELAVRLRHQPLLWRRLMAMAQGRLCLHRRRLLRMPAAEAAAAARRLAFATAARRNPLSEVGARTHSAQPWRRRAMRAAARWVATPHLAILIRRTAARVWSCLARALYLTMTLGVQRTTRRRARRTRTFLGQEHLFPKTKVTPSKPGTTCKTCSRRRSSPMSVKVVGSDGLTDDERLVRGVGTGFARPVRNQSAKTARVCVVHRTCG